MLTDSAKILLIDDQADILELLTIILSEEGYVTHATTKSQSAVTLAEEFKPDLILLDVMMPLTNGYEVCSELKNNQNTNKIPIIFISALNNTQEKIKGFELGCADYITKPFDIDEVIARIKYQLEIKLLQKQLQETNQVLQQELNKRIAIENKLLVKNQKLQNLAELDSLTQVANRRKFDLKLQQEWQRLAREGQPLSLIIIDIDGFKLYNDTYGHQAGDHCIQQVAQAISQSVKRPADLVARYGGEEFAIILPYTDLKGATHVAKRIQTAIADLRISHTASSINNFVTASQGITTTIPTNQISWETLIATADAALYEAKNNGRNGYISRFLS